VMAMSCKLQLLFAIVWLVVCLFVYLFIYLFVCLSTYFFVFIQTCTFTHLHNNDDELVDEVTVKGIEANFIYSYS
jgi:hypothetical protein